MKPMPTSIYACLVVFCIGMYMTYYDLSQQQIVIKADVRLLNQRCDDIEKSLRKSVIHPRFFRHCIDCRQCGTRSPESSLCEEGFELFKDDLREGKK